MNMCCICDSSPAKNKSSEDESLFCDFCFQSTAFGVYFKYNKERHQEPSPSTVMQGIAEAVNYIEKLLKKKRTK